MSYADIYNATLNELKEGISEGENLPDQCKNTRRRFRLYDTSKEQLRNVKPEITRVNLPPDMLQYDNMTTERGGRTEENDKISDRINPEMLTLLKEPTYTIIGKSFLPLKHIPTNLFV